MDNQRDYHRFRSLLARMCETLGKPLTDELLESWWKALRHVDFDVVSNRIEAFLARADEATRFPRPAQMRPKHLVPADPDQPQRNHVRDYWRSAVVYEAGKAVGLSMEQLEPYVEEMAASFGTALRELINELEGQETRDGRTIGQHRYCQREAERIARVYVNPRLEVA